MFSPVIEHQTPSIVKSNLNVIKILMVDDDYDDAELVCDTIEEISPKYEVICMQQSKQVLEILDAFKYTDLPALIILDYNMPIFSGLDLLKLLKANLRYLHIPVVVYSNSVYPKHKEECLDAGACIYLSKSTTVQGLHDDIKQLLSHCL